MSKSVINKPVITNLNNKSFAEILKQNPGILIVKIGAAWCKPCQQIKSVVDAFFASSPDNVICADIDIVDKKNEELYLLLKKKLRLQGIPCMLMYRSGNLEFIPNEIVTGSDPASLHSFFKKCGNELNEIEKTIVTSYR
jgi:thioredoxin-like negative regulator of GroEL